MSEHFQAIQHSFTAYLRNPDRTSPPQGIEPRRLKIYCDLFYNNIVSFLSQGFPVIHQILTEKGLWHALARDFFASHTCKSPYFSDISGEFVAYLSQIDALTSPYPPYLAELAHYEWLEMVLDIARDDLDDTAINPDGDLLNAAPVLNPVYRIAQYQWSVTTISPDQEPTEPLPSPLLLLLFRDRAFRVRFVEINALTHMLIQQISDNPTLAGEQHLRALSHKLPQVDPQQIARFGGELLEDFHQREFILGTANQSPHQSM